MPDNNTQPFSGRTCSSHSRSIGSHSSHRKSILTTYVLLSPVVCPYSYIVVCSSFILQYTDTFAFRLCVTKARKLSDHVENMKSIFIRTITIIVKISTLWPCHKHFYCCRTALPHCRCLWAFCSNANCQQRSTTYHPQQKCSFHFHKLTPVLKDTKLPTDRPTSRPMQSVSFRSLSCAMWVKCASCDVHSWTCHITRRAGDTCRPHKCVSATGMQPSRHATTSSFFQRVCSQICPQTFGHFMPRQTRCQHLNSNTQKR